MKECKVCNNVKDASEFYRCSSRKDGLQTRCKQCAKEYQGKNLGKFRKSNKKYYINNKEDVLVKQKCYRQNNKESRRKYIRAYKKANKHKVNAWAALRRTNKSKATPMWLTEAHFSQIEQFYIAAQDLRWEDEMHVDHIIPLNGVGVWGLHVPWNLQLLTKEENLKKGNRYDKGA